MMTENELKQITLAIISGVLLYLQIIFYQTFMGIFSIAMASEEEVPEIIIILTILTIISILLLIIALLIIINNLRKVDTESSIMVPTLLTIISLISYLITFILYTVGILFLSS